MDKQGGLILTSYPKGALFSVPELMLEMSRIYMPQAEEKRVRLLLEVTPAVPLFLEGDADGLRRILTELLDAVFAIDGRKRIAVLLDHDGEATLTLKVDDTGLSGVDPGCDRRMGHGSECCRLIHSVLGTWTLEDSEASGCVCTVSLPYRLSDANPALEPGDAMVIGWLTADLEISDLAEGVLRSVPDRMDRIRRLARSGEDAALKEVVHAFKGTAGNFHMNELYQCLLEIDMHLKDHPSSEEPFCKWMNALECIVRRIPEKYLKRANGEEILELK